MQVDVNKSATLDGNSNNDIMTPVADNNDKLLCVCVCGDRVQGDKPCLGKGDGAGDLCDDPAQDNGQETEVRQDVEVTIVTIMVIIWSSMGWEQIL